MKVLILILVTASTFSAAALAPSDDELKRALYNISERREIRGRTWFGVARELSIPYAIAGLALAQLPASRGLSRTFGVWLFRGAAAGYVVGWLGPNMYAPPAARPLPKEFRSTKDLEYFFSLERGRQFELARPSPELTRFVMDVSDAYDFAARGLPGARPWRP